MVLRCGNRWIFRRQIGVVITQHNVVEDLAHQCTNRRTRTTVLQNHGDSHLRIVVWRKGGHQFVVTDRKSTRLNSSHVSISYAVFCLKKKNNDNRDLITKKQGYCYGGDGNRCTTRASGAG